MLCYETVAAVLERARRLDPAYELFGASRHQYRLNPPAEEAAVRAAEVRYQSRLPEDYRRFITRIADGGAGPDYGILPFADSLMANTGSWNSVPLFTDSPTADVYEAFREAYRNSLKNPFAPRRMLLEEVNQYDVCSTDAYAQHPEHFFVLEKDEDAVCGTDGFLILGTHGCQWDFGLVVSGEQTGQMFVTDNENGFAFLASSFSEFYRDWLRWLSDPKNLQRELERRRRLRAEVQRCRRGKERREF